MSHMKRGKKRLQWLEDWFMFFFFFSLPLCTVHDRKKKHLGVPFACPFLSREWYRCRLTCASAIARLILKPSWSTVDYVIFAVALSYHPWYRQWCVMGTRNYKYLHRPYEACDDSWSFSFLLSFFLCPGYLRRNILSYILFSELHYPTYGAVQAQKKGEKKLVKFYIKNSHIGDLE